MHKMLWSNYSDNCHYRKTTALNSSAVFVQASERNKWLLALLLLVRRRARVLVRVRALPCAFACTRAHSRVPVRVCSRVCIRAYVCARVPVCARVCVSSSSSRYFQIVLFVLSRNMNLRVTRASRACEFPVGKSASRLLPMSGLR